MRHRFYLPQQVAFGKIVHLRQGLRYGLDDFFFLLAHQITPFRAIILPRGEVNNVNKYCLSILKYAYSKYQESGSVHYSVVLSGNADDIVGLRNAIRNLEEGKYIENVSQNGLDVSFDLSAIGIEYMRSYGKL